MRFVELFAGIGGFRLGLENTGHTCVFSNEWLEKPASIYKRRFGSEPDRRDIRLIQGGELPECELIVGGFPCATFSQAGKRTGFSIEDTRGTLCFEMFRLARDRGIPYILFENVKGMLNHDNGKTFAVIISALHELGYDCQWELLDSQNFGVPQHRERIFLVANLREKPRPKVFPIGRSKREHEKENRKAKFRHEKPKVTQWRRGHFRDYRGKGIPTLTANMGTGGHNVPFIKGEGIRKLTPIECERLQGLPDGWTKYYKNGDMVSDSERYERCGRTVSIPVIEAIGRRLYDFFQ